MIVPQFLRFYSGYTLSSLMDEFAVTFFSLVNSMYRLYAEEMLDSISTTSIAFSGDESAIMKLRDRARGIHGIVQEVRVIKP